MLFRVSYATATPSLFSFTDTATPAIYTRSLHDALPICASVRQHPASAHDDGRERLRAPSARWSAKMPSGSGNVTLTDMLCRSLCGSHRDRKSTRLNSSHTVISYAVFCLIKKRCSSESPTPQRLRHFFLLLIRPPPLSTLVPYTTLFRSAHQFASILHPRTMTVENVFVLPARDGPQRCLRAQAT